MRPGTTSLPDASITSAATVAGMEGSTATTMPLRIATSAIPSRPAAGSMTRPPRSSTSTFDGTMALSLPARGQSDDQNYSGKGGGSTQPPDGAADRLPWPRRYAIRLACEIGGPAFWKARQGDRAAEAPASAPP